MKEIVFIGSSQFCQESQIKAESIWNKIGQRTGLSWISSSASDSFCPSYNEALSGIQTITSSKRNLIYPCSAVPAILLVGLPIYTELPFPNHLIFECKMAA